MAPVGPPHPSTWYSTEYCVFMPRWRIHNLARYCFALFLHRNCHFAFLRVGGPRPCHRVGSVVSVRPSGVNNYCATRAIQLLKRREKKKRKGNSVLCIAVTLTPPLSLHHAFYPGRDLSVPIYREEGKTMTWSCSVASEPPVTKEQVELDWNPKVVKL